MTDASDQELWAAVVAARRELNRVQADFYQNAQDPVGVLRDALKHKSWDQTTALRYLDGMVRDTLPLLPELVGLAVSDRTHGWACEAISHIPLDTLVPALRPIIAERLAGEDWYEYQRLGGLLGQVQAWDSLRDLIARALRSSDPEIREVGENLDEHYTVLHATEERPPDPSL